MNILLKSFNKACRHVASYVPVVFSIDYYVYNNNNNNVINTHPVLVQHAQHTSILLFYDRTLQVAVPVGARIRALVLPYF